MILSIFLFRLSSFLSISEAIQFFVPLWSFWFLWIIFVNDGSSDDSNQQIEKLIDEDKSIRYIELSRNFGKEIAITVGLYYAYGYTAIVIDANKYPS